jgi:hypothetical protein
MLLNLFFNLSYQPSIGIRIQGWILVGIRQMCTWYWDWYGLGMKLILPQVTTRQVGTVSRLILFSILLVLVWTILWYQASTSPDTWVPDWYPPNMSDHIGKGDTLQAGTGTSVTQNIHPFLHILILIYCVAVSMCEPFVCSSGSLLPATRLL